MWPETFAEKLRRWVGAVGWELFLWSVSLTEEEYFDEIYRQECARREWPPTKETP
jgi:hypothetical protein